MGGRNYRARTVKRVVFRRSGRNTKRLRIGSRLRFVGLLPFGVLLSGLRFEPHSILIVRRYMRALMFGLSQGFALSD